MVTGIGYILIFIGKALIMILSGWIAYIILMNASIIKDKLYSPIFPVVIAVGVAYLLASIFLSIYSFAATTILHCFILDEEVKGNHAPKSLMSFIERNNQHNEKKNKGKAPADEKPAQENGQIEKPANNIA